MEVLAIFSVNAKVGLHRNWLFWIAILLPLCFAIFFALPLMRNVTFHLTADGYDFFISQFQFPLWISSGSLVLGIMVARFHSSEQRALTIAQSVSQNNFSNYLNHRDHFSKYIVPIAESYKLEVDPYRLYGIIFSNSTPATVDTALSQGIADFYARCFEQNFWTKMKFSAPNFSTKEVNIYYPRFLKEVGFSGDKREVVSYEELKSQLISIRHIYRKAMEYGATRDTQMTLHEDEESRFSELIGEFQLWSNNNGFNLEWK